MGYMIAGSKQTNTFRSAPSGYIRLKNEFQEAHTLIDSRGVCHSLKSHMPLPEIMKSINSQLSDFPLTQSYFQKLIPFKNKLIIDRPITCI